MDKTWDDRYDVKTVSTKLSSLEFLHFKKYCEGKGVSPSSLLRDLIFQEIRQSTPVNTAGRNVFLYNKAKDNFSWRVMLDSGLRVDVEDNLSAEFVSQLFDSIKEAVDERNTYIKKESKESVAVPSKLVRKGI